MPVATQRACNGAYTTPGVHVIPLTPLTHTHTHTYAYTTPGVHVIPLTPHTHTHSRIHHTKGSISFPSRNSRTHTKKHVKCTRNNVSSRRELGQQLPTGIVADPDMLIDEPDVS